MQVAQTNVQLFRQLRAGSWDTSDLRRAVASYELAVRLFSGCVRVTGKSFVAHLIGTASIVATNGARTDMVLAALLHAAYDRGDFGDGTPGIAPEKRRWLAEQLGRDVERLVAAYTTTPWDHAAVAHLTELAANNDLQRDVVALRLANDLEELLDREHRYQLHGDVLLDRLRLAPAVARRHGMTAVAQQLESAIADDVDRPENNDGEFARPPNALRFVPPLSYRPRLRVTLARTWRGLRRRLR
jgi:(p)ppGpp synthase/HD superfamily hydrolase